MQLTSKQYSVWLEVYKVALAVLKNIQTAKQAADEALKKLTGRNG